MDGDNLIIGVMIGLGAIGLWFALYMAPLAVQ